MRTTRLLATLSLTLAVATTRPVWAGCTSDCKDTYASDVESCQMINGDDPDDADELRSCLDSAQDDFSTCKDDCNS
jgi:hypothetical protein